MKGTWFNLDAYILFLVEFLFAMQDDIDFRFGLKLWRLSLITVAKTVWKSPRIQKDIATYFSTKENNYTSYRDFKLSAGVLEFTNVSGSRVARSGNTTRINFYGGKNFLLVALCSGYVVVKYFFL